MALKLEFLKKFKFFQWVGGVVSVLDATRKIVKELIHIKDVVINYNSDKDDKNFALPGKEQPDYKQANAYAKYAVKLYIGIGKAVIAEAQDGD